MDYEFLRQAADSWGLLYLVLLFLGVIAFTFRPGSRDAARDRAEIPFKEDDADVR